MRIAEFEVTCEPREENDGRFPAVLGEVRDFAFEGFRESPEVWVDWLVRARSVAIEVDT